MKLTQGSHQVFSEFSSQIQINVSLKSQEWSKEEGANARNEFVSRQVRESQESYEGVSEGGIYTRTLKI